MVPLPFQGRKKARIFRAPYAFVESPRYPTILFKSLRGTEEPSMTHFKILAWLEFQAS